MDTRTIRHLSPGVAALLCLLAPAAGAQIPQDTPATDQAPASAQLAAPPPASHAPRTFDDWIDAAEKYKLSLLPEPVRDGLYVDLWGWASYLNAGRGDHRANGDGQLSLQITKSFAGRVALTTELSLLDADGHTRLAAEQLFASALLSQESQIFATAGKFHANIGVEGRDFWDRSTGTTSLLFSAQPQDLIGALVCVPLGDTDITLRPFIATNFQGTLSFSQPPSGGLIMQYKPHRSLTITLTNWVGPGFAAPEYDNEEDEEYGGSHGYVAWAQPHPSASSGYGWSEESDEYTSGQYGSGPYRGSVGPVENWMGPHLTADPTGTLYFVDGKIVWTPRNDLTLSGEALLGITPSSDGAAGWQGCLVLATYDITDQWSIFGRWSFLNDSSGLITGTAQRRHEISTGLAWKIVHNVELRGEYRHDFSPTQGDLDTLSLHLLFHF